MNIRIFNNNRLFKDITGVLSSNILNSVLVFIASILVARWLGPANKGTYTAILVIPNLIIGISTLGSRQSIIHFIGKKVFEKKVLFSSIILIYALSTAISLLLCTIGFFLVPVPDATLAFFILILLFLPLRMLLNFAGGIFTGEGSFKKANFIKWAPPLFYFLSVTVLVGIFKLSIWGALLSLLASNLLTVIFVLFFLFNNYAFSFKEISKEAIISIMGKGIVFAFALLLLQLNYRVDIIFLQILSDISQVGFYSIGVAVAEELWQIPIAAGTVINSRSANSKESELSQLNETVSRTLRISFLLCTMGAVLLFFVLPLLIPILLGLQFIPSITIAQMILPGILIFSFVRILASALAGYGKPWVVIYVLFPSLVINMILNYFLIPIYQANGAAIATNISYAFGSLFLLFAYSRVMSYPIMKIVQYRKTDFVTIRNFFLLQKKTDD